MVGVASLPSDAVLSQGGKEVKDVKVYSNKGLNRAA